MGHEQKPLLSRPNGWFRFNEPTFTGRRVDISNAPFPALRCPMKPRVRRLREIWVRAQDELRGEIQRGTANREGGRSRPPQVSRLEKRTVVARAR